VRILLTNDDGIHAEGLAALERIARQFSEDVWVVAPEHDQSGFAHSLSISDPLRLRKIGEKHYAVRGTPTDCVIMGCKKIMPDLPDLILSGINSGSNTADDVTYSGTIAGAMEGTMLGIRSFALSQAYNVQNEMRVVPWATAEALAPALLQRLIETDLPHGVLLNINFPNCPPDDVAGTLVTTQGKLTYGLWIEERADGRGFPYYWLRFGREKPSDVIDGSDMAALRDRKISVTPLKLDLTAHEVMDDLARALA
jgi:5'-nucleotidase